MGNNGERNFGSVGTCWEQCERSVNGRWDRSEFNAYEGVRLARGMGWQVNYGCVLGFGAVSGESKRGIAWKH